MKTSLPVAAAVLLSLLTTTTLAASRPHIVMIVADDLGWADVGWRDPDMVTPNLDSLVSEGVNLTNAYVQPLCSPSRAAFLSGKYPFKIGMQHSVLDATYNTSLPLGLTLLPEKLQALGYSTHLVGKWHLGFCSWNMTPTYRGFDSFYGMYLGKGEGDVLDVFSILTFAYKFNSKSPNRPVSYTHLTLPTRPLV